MDDGGIIEIDKNVLDSFMESIAALSEAESLSINLLHKFKGESVFIMGKIN